MPRPRLDHVRKAQILSAAAEVLTERGYANSRVVDIAKAAGTSPAAILYWFDGKDAAERHDYQYTPAELEPWVSKIKRSGVGSAYVFFQNTTRGQGLTNAREFQTLWDSQS